jgi:hypothetical protein
MKVRAKANGNVVDLPDSLAHALVEAGIFEFLSEPAATVAEPADRPKRQYRRRDMRVE